MLNPNPGQESFEDQFMDLLRSYELIMEESRYHPNVIVEAEAFSKFVNDILSAYQATTDQRVTEARIEEVKGFITNHSSTHNPDYKVEDGYGAYCNCDRDPTNKHARERIATLTQKEDTHGR